MSGNPSSLSTKVSDLPAPPKNTAPGTGNKRASANPRMAKSTQGRASDSLGEGG